MDRNTRYCCLALADDSEPRDADRASAAASAHIRKTADSVAAREIALSGTSCAG